MRKLLFIVCLWSIGISFAQEKQTALDKLMAKEWCFKVLNRAIVGTKNFGRENMMENLVIEDGRSASAEKPFYLSNIPETEFDRNKVGKSEDGSYVIVFNDKTGDVDVFRILLLTDESFTWQSVGESHMQPAPVTYEAREKP